MTRQVILSFVFLLICTSLFSQNRNDSITEIQTRSGIYFKQSGKTLNLKELQLSVSDNPNALELIKTAKTYYYLSNVLINCAIFLINYPIGYFIPTGYFNTTMFAIGCGLRIIAIPITIVSKNKMKLAIKAFNSESTSVLTQERLDIQIGYTSNGLGFKISI